MASGRPERRRLRCEQMGTLPPTMRFTSINLIVGDGASHPSFRAVRCARRAFVRLGLVQYWGSCIAIPADFHEAGHISAYRTKFNRMASFNQSHGRCPVLRARAAPRVMAARRRFPMGVALLRRRISGGRWLVLNFLKFGISCAKVDRTRSFVEILRPSPGSACDPLRK